MHKRFAALVSCAWLLVTGAASPAHADVRLDSKFVDLLARPGAARHPFADASGRLPLTVELPPGTDARSMGWQPFAPGLASLRVAPSDLGVFEAAHPGVRFSIWPRLRPVLDQSAKLNGTIAYREALAVSGSPLSGTGKGVVVGIIDTGLDVKHPDFLDATGKTRVAWLLDMSQPPQKKHPELEKEFGCNDAMQTPCAVFEKGDIDAVFANPPGLLPRDPVGHGTHVASIAAGNGGGGSGARFVGGAPEATLIIAGVTHGAVEEVTDTDIATGARFIFDRADALGMPAVINLSLGGDFGPHDGTTPLEKALAAMVGPDHPGHAIIVAAGNSGTLYKGDRPSQTLGIHTQTRVNRELPIRVPVVSPGVAGGADISGAVFVWATFEKTTDIAVGLEGPRGLSIEPVGAGHQGSFASGDNRLKAAIFNSVYQDEAPLTADTHGAIIAWDGSWPAGSEMILRFEGDGFVDAWMQTSLDASGEEAYFEVAIRDGTINVPATHPDLIAVGCTVNRTSWIDSDGNAFDVGAAHGLDLFGPVDSTCYFSSAGPTATGVMKPEISAPGALVAAAMSEDAAPAKGKESIFDAPDGICKNGNACFVVDPGHALLSGSSMSSPQVVGAVALLLERDPALTEPELLRLLEQGARRPQGVVGADYQLGVGALDVAGAIAAYDARSSPVTRDPDAASSWMSLSESYAHPDARWSVSGSIELRARDGSLADGFDPHRLSLQATGGEITEPLARIDTGLWRFAVTGAMGTGSRAIDIDVRFDGVSLGQPGTRLSGHRSLPIGADRWIAVGTARAYGGCSLATPTSQTPMLATVLLLVLVPARRRRGLRSAPLGPNALCFRELSDGL
jgi:subtilisin family serine protease